jgi:hypothetical protein
MLVGFEGTVGSFDSLWAATRTRYADRFGKAWKAAHEPIPFGNFINGPQAETVGRATDQMIRNAPPIPQAMMLKPISRQIGLGAGAAFGSVHAIGSQFGKLASSLVSGSVADQEYQNKSVQDAIALLRDHGFINQLVKSYAKKGKARYFEGPTTLGEQSSSIAQAGVNFIAANCARDEELIIAGYSRGGLVAVNVCNELAKRGRETQLLILFDPVDRANGPSTQNVSAAVHNCILIQREHAMVAWVPYKRTESVFGFKVSFTDVALTQSRFWFGKMVNDDDKASLTKGNFRHGEFDATHAAFGGVPWEGDKPDYLSQPEDRLQATRMAQFLNLEVGRLTNGWCPMLSLTMSPVRGN